MNSATTERQYSDEQMFELNMKIASEINKTCPIILDKETRLDNTVAMPNNALQYNYTLINMEKETSDTTELKNYILPIVTNGIKTSPQMEFQRKNRTTLKYYYKDKNGKYLFHFVITAQNMNNEITSQISASYDSMVAPASDKIIESTEDSKPINEREFNSTMEWIEGKANQNITYAVDGGDHYDIRSSLSNNGTICTYSTYSSKWGSKENQLVSYYRFNIKDITTFEIHDPQTFVIDNSYFTVKLNCINSEFKIKWTKWFQEDKHKPQDIFEKYDEINEANFYFSSVTERKKVSKALSDLLKYAGSKKEKY